MAELPTDHDGIVEELRSMAGDAGDVEAQHWMADDMLVKFVRSLGYDEMADAFEAVGKWYA